MLDKLIITQEQLRNPEQIKELKQFLNEGKVLSLNNLRGYKCLIELVEFEDGQIYIRDGHHRCLALSGIRDLKPEEYNITKMKYKDWLFTNVDKGWITPMNPKTEVRLAEFSGFKQEVKNLPYPENIKYIWNNRHLYCKKRTISYVQEITL